MKKVSILVVLLLILSINGFAQSGNSNPDSLLCYYPFHTGDKWVYGELYFATWPPYGGSVRDKSIEIGNDTIMQNNKMYKKFIEYRNGSYYNPSITYERIDSATARVYEYDPWADTTDYEFLKLDLTMKVGDTLFTSKYIISFDEENAVAYFDEAMYARHYSHIAGLVGYGDHYLYDFGLYKYTWAADFVYSESNLRGCIIDNKVYGDTSFNEVSVSKDENVLPSAFELKQNYPNPFNPATTISFAIPQPEHVTLKIYDVLGREVSTLVDETLNTGEYKKEFEAKNLSSGIYFYQLKAGMLNSTKKLILLK